MSSAAELLRGRVAFPELVSLKQHQGSLDPPCAGGSALQDTPCTPGQPAARRISPAMLIPAMMLGVRGVLLQTHCRQGPCSVLGAAAGIPGDS